MITQGKINNMLSGLLVMDLEHLKVTNPALCNKVVEMFRNTTKWQRDLTFDELKILHQFIDDNRMEMNPANFRYGQTG